jgi:glc operon protein GlcG
MHQFDVLSHADAQKIVAAIQAKVEKDSKGVAIAVVDTHGELLAFLRTDGCPLPSITIAINKAYTAARERKPSRALGDASRKDDFPLTNFGELRYVGWGGGLPLFHRGRVVGGVGVSGLPEDEDIRLAQIGVDALGLNP